jgi:hypothetical protein
MYRFIPAAEGGMDMSDPEARAEAFIERVDEELGLEPDYAPELGEELGWVSFELLVELQGETFEADVDFELSTTGVEILYAEMTVDPANTHRRALLHEAGERLVGGEGFEDYQYEPDEAEFEPLLSDLREIHAEVFD